MIETGWMKDGGGMGPTRSSWSVRVYFIKAALTPSLAFNAGIQERVRRTNTDTKLILLIL